VTGSNTNAEEFWRFQTIRVEFVVGSYTIVGPLVGVDTPSRAIARVGIQTSPVAGSTAGAPTCQFQTELGKFPDWFAL
jgi:hypothetical protein